MTMQGENRNQDLRFKSDRSTASTRKILNTFAAILKTSTNNVKVTLLHAAEHPVLILGGSAIFWVSILICRISEIIVSRW